MSNLQEFLANGGLVPQPDYTEDCQICKEPATEPVAVAGITCAANCFHNLFVFCRECILGWWEFSPNCVSCREPIFAEEVTDGSTEGEGDDEHDSDSDDEGFLAFSLPVRQHDDGTIILSSPFIDSEMMATHINYIHDWYRHPSTSVSIEPNVLVRIDLAYLISHIVTDANHFLGYVHPMVTHTDIKDMEAFIVALYAAINRTCQYEGEGAILTHRDFHRHLLRWTFDGALTDSTGEFDLFREAARDGLELPAARTIMQNYAMDLVQDVAIMAAYVHEYYELVLD
ncbi:Putative Zinc finger, RING-type [Septoria linicola]|uniref:Zinc finger, RING-type n=1 Tax=Septoria linicola TaxID=215465 RepID=A0A9Q9B3M3_9PEZI|nr:Putative Zinc finger, RING-type [Septoria linicola]